MSHLVLLLPLIEMKFIIITNNPRLARRMALAGVDRIMVDLEINGKAQRQGHLDTVISRHTFHEVSEIRESLNHCGLGELMVRINPLNENSLHEINEVLSAVLIE